VHLREIGSVVGILLVAVLVEPLALPDGADCLGQGRCRRGTDYERRSRADAMSEFAKSVHRVERVFLDKARGEALAGRGVNRRIDGVQAGGVPGWNSDAGLKGSWARCAR
jgi:hypothetical protein